MTPQAIRGFFDSEAIEYVRGREQEHSFRSQKEIVLEMLADAPPGRVLDLGCGPAMMEEALLDLGHEVWGIDASEQMIGYGRARLAGHPLRSRCHLGTGDAELLPHAHGFFDAIVCMGMLEYLPDHGPALREMHRALKSGGVAVLTIPSQISAYHVARRSYHRTLALAKRLRARPAEAASFAVNLCVPWKLDRELERAGLRKIAARACNFIFFPLHDKHPKASLALNRGLSRLPHLSDTPLGLVLGAQYVVKAQKR
jgi:ubiquinone/menaquinone biosynthesis C-methylase UbiE